MRARTAAVFFGLAVGMAAGWGLVRRQIRQHQRDLFSRKPLRRLAALTHLAQEAGAESVPLLRDYLAWEPRPFLRRRAERILRQLDLSFG